MPFYNNYTLSLGIIIPSFCIKLLSKKDNPWRRNKFMQELIVRNFNSKDQNHLIVTELPKHGIYLDNDLIYLDINPLHVNPYSVTVEFLCKLIGLLKEAQNCIYQSLSKKAIIKELYLLYCQDLSVNKFEETFNSFIVDPDKLLIYLKSHNLKIEIGKEDLDFCL